MANFNRGNDSRGRRDFGNRGFGGGRSDREMFTATCADCGRECQIPFKPSPGRPVYCDDDFKKHSPSEGGPRRNDNRSFSRDRGHKSQNQNPPQLNEINAKLDKILALLSSASDDKSKKAEAILPDEVVTEAPKAKKSKKTSEEKVPKDILETSPEIETESVDPSEMAAGEEVTTKKPRKKATK